MQKKSVPATLSASKLYSDTVLETMGEIKREIKTYEVQYICDACHQGFMLVIDSTPTSYALTAYAHQCEKCGHQQSLKSCYPERRVE